MADISIIELPVSRWREFKELRLEALRDSPQAFGSSYKVEVTRPQDHWTGRLRDAEAGRAFSLFAEHDGKLVGMIGAFFEAAPEVATIVAVYVQPEHRGQGVGKLLVDAVMARLRDHPGTKRATLVVNVEQSRAVNLYEQAGFVEVGRERVPLGDGKEHDELILERSLV